MIGSKLAQRYEILRELGRGGMGVVYLAYDTVLERDVAVKVITPDMVSSDTAERFKREAKVVAKMDHPSIVSVYDSGEQDGALFFVMSYVQGENLRYALRSQTLQLGELVDIAIQIADALDYSHSRGVVHRDIKPENIMVDRKPGEGIRVRVTDFGLAMAPAHDRITKSSAVVGTVAYMSPEQVKGAVLGPPSDIYSFGTVFYECLVGQTPFSGEILTLIYRISHEIPISPKSLAVEIDDEVVNILLSCLEKDPSMRPTGKEVVTALTNYKFKLKSTGRHRMKLPSATTMSTHLERPTVRPFVGREKEFAELQRRLNIALTGECQFALVGGEAGIGKSRLLEEMETLATVRNISVLHGRFLEVNHALPYQGFCETIQEYFRSRTTTSTSTDFSDLASDLIALFPVLAEVRELSRSSDEAVRIAPDASPKKFEDRTYIFEMLARTLIRMAGGKPLVLLLEDLHAADVSLEALDYIIRRLAPTATFIIGTYRTTEVDKRHRLTKLLSGFKGDKRFLLQQLGPLTPSNHRLFLEKLMGGSNLDEALAERFYRATEGNPYFTTELVRSLMDSGAIVRDNTGAFRLSSETALNMEELPVTIQQAVEERIERLPEDLKELLSLASVLGRSFEFGHLENLATDQENMEDAVEQLVRAGFVEEDRQSRSDRLSFSSGVVRDVLYSSLPRRKRRNLHKKHAEELEKRNQGRVERVYPQLFEHYTQADVPEKVIEYGFLLAHKSLDAFSPEDAIRVTQTVIDFLEEDTGDGVSKAEAKTLLASAQRMLGNTGSALKELEEAVSLFDKAKDNARALESILEAAQIAWHGLKVDDAKRWADRGLQLARSTNDLHNLLQLLSLAATIANMRGEYKKGQEYLEEAERVKPTRDEPVHQAAAGGTLLVAATRKCEARHPAQTFTNEEAEVLANVYETLVTTDAQGNLLPHLCERWETLNEGALFLFVLRKDVRMHDGRPMMAQEVKISIEEAVRRCTRAMPPAFAPIRGVPEFQNGTYSHISGVVALSENIIEIQLTDRIGIYPALLTDLRTAIAVPGSRGEEFAGTGPFRIASFQPENISLERTTGYWKGNDALLDRIEFRSGLSSSDIAEAFRARKFDLIRDLLPQDLEEILRDSKQQASLVESLQKNAYFVIFNSSSSLGQIQPLRQALAGTARMNDLVPSTVGRLAQPAQGLLPPGILGHDPGKRRPLLPLEKAKQLIQSTGLPLPLRLRAAIQPLLQDRYSALTRALFRVWSQIGVEISIETPDPGSFNDSWLKNEDVDLMITRWIGDYDDPDSFTYSLFHSRIGELRKYYSSNEFDEKVEKARNEKQPDIRERLYREIENWLLDQGFVIPLFHDIDYRVFSSSVQGVTLSNTPPFVNYLTLSKKEPAGTQREEKGKGVLHIPVWGELENLDPAWTIRHAQATIFPAIFETLTRAADGARIIPWLAKSFQAEDGGRRFRFQLRDGIKFHDGRRLTARDVRYSFERALLQKESQAALLLEPILGAARLMRGESKELEGFRISSALEFILDLEQPLSFFASILAYAPTAILPEGSEPAKGNWRNGCIGTGPFRVVDFSDQHLKLEANPYYWIPGQPKIDSLEFTLGISPAEIFSGFQSGRFSIGWNLMASDAERLMHDSEFATRYQQTPSMATQYLVFNIHKGPFADENLRKRFTHAIDWSSFARKKLGRYILNARTLTPPSLLAYEPPKMEVVPNHQGEPIEINGAFHGIYLTKYEPFTKEVLEALREQGFIVRILERRVEDQSFPGSLECDFQMTNWIADYPDADTFLYSLLHSKTGIIGYLCGTEELDRLLERSRTETDSTTRQAIFRQVEDVIQRHYYVLPLFHEQNYCFFAPELNPVPLNFFDPILPFEKISFRS